MKEKQLEVVVGLLSGVQAAVVALCNALHDKGVLHKSESARYFSTESIPPDLRNGPIGMVFRHIQEGIQTSQNSTERAEQARQLFRVLDGSHPASDETTPPKEPSA